MKYIIDSLRGFCMALADSVPGVSGGTVAFILGFYDKFINSIDTLFSRGALKEDKKIALHFIIRFGIGWAIGMILAVLFLSSIFESHIYAVTSVFLGFILFSIPLVIRAEKESIVGKYKNLIFSFIGLAIVVLITIFNPMAGTETTMDVSGLSFGVGIYIFIAAVLAVSAMIIPGISGSTLLMIMGLYLPIIEALKELLHLNFIYLPTVLIFGVGLVVGIIFIIRVIKIALKKFRSQTIYLILGLMVGSLYTIIMSPQTLDIPQEPINFQTFNAFFFVLGGLIIFGLEKMKKIIEKKIGE